MVDVLSADDRRRAALVALIHQQLRIGQSRDRPLTVNLGSDDSISVRVLRRGDACLSPPCQESVDAGGRPSQGGQGEGRCQARADAAV